MRTAALLLAITFLSCVVEALNPQLKALFSEFSDMEITSQEFSDAFEKVVLALEPQEVWNWNETYAYKDDEGRLPEHDVVNMTMPLWNKIRQNEGPESEKTWFMAIITDTYPEMPHSRGVMCAMRYLAEMYQGKYRFAAVIPDTVDGWHVLQMTQTFIYPGIYIIEPDGQGGHDMIESMPLFISTQGFASWLENIENGRFKHTFREYKMPRPFNTIEFAYMNWWREHFYTPYRDKWENEVSQWTHANKWYNGNSIFDEFKLDERWFAAYEVPQRSHIALIGGSILIVCLLLCPFVSLCCVCFCCCRGVDKKPAGGKSQKSKSASVAPKKVGQREKIE